MYIVRVQDETRDLKEKLATANAEIMTLKMRLKNAELMLRFAASEKQVVKKVMPEQVQRN
jgi:hypothetical protein